MNRREAIKTGAALVAGLFVPTMVAQPKIKYNLVRQKYYKIVTGNPNYAKDGVGIPEKILEEYRADTLEMTLGNGRKVHCWLDPHNEINTSWPNWDTYKNFEEYEANCEEAEVFAKNFFGWNESVT